MILPTSYLATLVVIILGMLCWGLWANTFKLAGNWRFELYYLDFAFGASLLAVVAALTAGTLGFDGFSFTDDLLHAGKTQDLEGFIAGMIFNFGNMLLVAAVGLAGLSIALPVAMGVALVLDVILAFIFRPQGNSAVLFAGAAIILVALVTAIYAFRYYRLSQVDELVKTGKVKSTRRRVSLKGVFVALVSGLFLGGFLPLLEKSQATDAGLGPYGETFVFAAGIMLSTILYNLFFMNLPVSGQPLEIIDYFKSPLRQHLMGLLGGVLWCSGMLLLLVGGRAEGTAALSPAAIFGISQSSTVIAALCGLLLWKEFAAADLRVRAMTFVMIVLFTCGLAMLAIGPTWSRS
ncbi:MAG: putative integral rane protein [Bryobacterales bacterium]|nr:putative integral rane protein [Bryobacterales bacterium]